MSRKKKDKFNLTHICDLFLSVNFLVKRTALKSKWSASVVCFLRLAWKCLFISSQPDLNAIVNGTGVTEQGKCQPDSFESVSPGLSLFLEFSQILESGQN